MATFLSSPLLPSLLGAFRGGTCLLVRSVQNPVHSLLLLIRVFLLGTALLFTLQREYFALLFLIVYVGAIVVLFLFVIRRLEIKRVNTTRRFRDLVAARPLVRGLLLLEAALLVSQDAFTLAPFLTPTTFTTAAALLPERNGTVGWAALLQRNDSLRSLGGVLYTERRTTLILAALLLFLARVGAIAVTLLPQAKPGVEGPFGPRPQVEGPQGVPAPRRLTAPLTRKRQDPAVQGRRHPTLVGGTVRTLRSLTEGRRSLR